MVKAPLAAGREAAWVPIARVAMAWSTHWLGWAGLGWLVDGCELTNLLTKPVLQGRLRSIKISVICLLILLMPANWWVLIKRNLSKNKDPPFSLVNGLSPAPGSSGFCFGESD